MEYYPISLQKECPHIIRAFKKFVEVHLGGYTRWLILTRDRAFAPFSTIARSKGTTYD
jgi:hypothetical protein